MKPIKSLIVLALIAAPGLAAAQGYYGPPPPEPGGFHRRAGHLTFGFSAGLGYMHDNGSTIVCQGCGGDAITGMLEGHIGGMLNSRLGLMLEIQGNAQQIAIDPTQDVTLRQLLVLGALQYWIAPIFWIKGGIGAANLDVLDNNTGVAYAVSDTGLGLLGAAGIELMSARRFALELQLRITEGIYHYTNGTDNITSGTIGIGLNWY
jgi:hypothetical protein